jgi:peptidoglycan/LPS O-acetylase OafA/YrhL
MMGKRFAAVHGLRGIAAFWVVLFHASAGGHIEGVKAALPQWLAAIVFDFGNMGVAVFFAISGFVITHSIEGARITPGYVGRFALRRSLRLDPPYWASIALVLVFAFGSAAVQAEPFRLPSTAQILAHLFYLQTLLGFEQISDVYWTLTYEIQFYLVLVLIMALAQRSKVPVSWLVLLPFAYTLGVWLELAPEVRGLFTNFWQCFAAGALAYWAMRDRTAIAPLAVVAAVTLSLSPTLFNFIGIGTAAGLLVLQKAGQLEQGLGWRPLQLLGTISYSLYLIHNPVTGAAFFLLAYLGVPQLAAFVLTVAVCIVAAWLFWLLIEAPSIKLARRLSLKAPAEPELLGA